MHDSSTKEYYSKCCTIYFLNSISDDFQVLKYFQALFFVSKDFLLITQSALEIDFSI
jgi:hypothetical protein